MKIHILRPLTVLVSGVYEGRKKVQSNDCDRRDGTVLHCETKRSLLQEEKAKRAQS